MKSGIVSLLGVPLTQAVPSINKFSAGAPTSSSASATLSDDTAARPRKPVRQNAGRILAFAGFKHLISVIKYQEFMPPLTLETTRVIKSMTAVLSETTRVIKSMSAVVPETTRVIKSMTAVLSKTTRVIESMTAVVSETTRVIKSMTAHQKTEFLDRMAG